MTPIKPRIIFHAHQASIESGIEITALILEHKGNNYHLYGSTGDTIHIFTESLAIYVLTINKTLSIMGLSAFMTAEPDPINSIYLHSTSEIEETVGCNWEQMKPEVLVRKLIECLI